MIIINAYSFLQSWCFAPLGPFRVSTQIVSILQLNFAMTINGTVHILRSFFICFRAFRIRIVTRMNLCKKKLRLFTLLSLEWLSFCPDYSTSFQQMIWNGFEPRGDICQYRHCWRQCKIFASGVNFSRNNAIYNINESAKYILSGFHL